MERLAVLQAMYAMAHIYVANMMLNIAPLFLSPDQEFITNIKLNIQLTVQTMIGKKYPG